MFEEVKEMIDSTIYTNGRGEVTAQNINLAMHGMVDATEEKFGEVNDAVKAVEDKVTALEENGTGGGEGALRVWANNLVDLENTEEQVAENVATFNILLSGVHASVLMCIDWEQSVPEAGYVAKQTMTIPVLATVIDIKSQDSNTQGVEMSFGDTSVGLLPDGSVEIIAEETPASSGPLRVWMNEENTPEQIAENVATYNTIKQNGLQSVALEYIDSENGETYESFFAPIETVVVSSSDGDYIYFKCIVDVKNGLSVVSEILLYEDGSIEY